MAVALPDLPRFLVLDPLSTVRVEMRLTAPACEIDVELDNPRPGRSFVLMIGHRSGPFVQRVRLSGKARIYFDPETPGEYVMLVANPQRDPIVLRLRARDVRPEEPATPAGERRAHATVATERRRRSSRSPGPKARPRSSVPPRR